MTAVEEPAVGPAPSVKSRRLLRGTKTEDYLNTLSDPNKPPSLSDYDGPFQVQEYLTALVNRDPHDVQKLVELPKWSSKGKERETSDSSGEGSSGSSAESKYIDRDVWLYEHLRRLAIDLSQPFVVTLQEHCTRTTCPEMKAGEWLYLCAAHASANETECCAIDYITHTLEGATALLNASRYFPSRLSVPPTSTKHFSSIARRLYRIFAHAWYHHREVFDLCESETSLYERFLALSREYDLVSPDLLIIPTPPKHVEDDGSERDSRRTDEAVLSNGSSGSDSSSSDEPEPGPSATTSEPGQEPEASANTTKEDE